MNAVAPRGRTAARALLPVTFVAMAACSSVASINDQAMQLLPERQSANGPLDPSRLIRPARTEYCIGARDLLEIEVYELEEPNQSKQLKLRVAQDGSITLPLLGQVPAAGRTVPDLHADLVARLAKDYLVNPSVSVVVAEHQARRVTVLGAVQHPGTFSLQDNSTTLVDVLALAGGPNERAGSVVYVVRENGLPPGVAVANAASGSVTTAAEAPRLVKVDLVDLVERGDLTANCVLDDGDVVHVPPAAQFFVMGEVNEGGAFPVRGEITLLRAIALAGGLKENATPSATVLIRTGPKGRMTVPIDLNEVQAGSEKDLLMQADDVLVVNESGGDRTLRGIGAFIRGLFTISYGLR